MKNLLVLITEMQALSQTGLCYAADEFDRTRYQRFLEISANLSAELCALKPEHVLELFAADTGYRTPKVDVRGALFKGDTILLVREKADHLWSLPGGWADINLTPSENIVQEIREESGYHCKVRKLIAVLDKNKNNPPKNWPYVYKMFFLCDFIDGSEGTFKESREISELNFFDLSTLPALSQGRVTAKQITMCFEHYHHPAIPTQFD